MKALLDTNVLLDAIASREPFCGDAQEIFLLAAKEQFEGIITANSLTDLYYIARKSLPDADVREALHKLFQIFTVADLCGAECEAALDLDMEDYEDAVAILCGRKAGAECVITRDARFLQESGEPRALTPASFLEELNQRSRACENT